MFDAVLIPLDGSPEAEGAIPYAIDEATRHDCGLVLIRVVPRPEFGDVRVPHGGPALAGRFRPLSESTAAEAAAMGYLSDVIRRHRLTAETETLVLTGNPCTRLEEEVARRTRPLVVLAAGDELARRPLLAGSATVMCVPTRQLEPIQPWQEAALPPFEPAAAAAAWN